MTLYQFLLPSSCLNLPPYHPLNSSPLLPSASANFSSSKLSLKFSRSRKWVCVKHRFNAKSADADEETSEVPPEFSSEGGRISSPADTRASSSFLSLLCPLLTLFQESDPSRERNYTLEVATSALSTFSRLPWGSRSLLRSSDTDSQDYMPLQLFEFEACPFCRRVREAMTELDLSVEVYPCPKGSSRHREMVRSLGGKEQFPFLVDPNSGISIYESGTSQLVRKLLHEAKNSHSAPEGDIVKYLFQQYGRGRSPSAGLLESTLFTGWVPTILRAGRGMMLWDKATKEPPPRKLELFSYENNPNARIVREALCELELPYILQNVGEGSVRSKLLFDASGSKEVPYIIDPNTGAKMGDYRRILSYLFKTYSVATV